MFHHFVCFLMFFALWIHPPEMSCNILCNIEYNDRNIWCTWPNLRCSVNWVSHHDNEPAQRPLKTTHFWFAPTQSSLPTNPAHRIWLPTTWSSSPKLSERATVLTQRRRSSMYHRWRLQNLTEVFQAWQEMWEPRGWLIHFFAFSRCSLWTFQSHLIFNHYFLLTIQTVYPSFLARRPSANWDV